MNTHSILQIFLKHGLSVSICDFGGDSVIIKFPFPTELNSFFMSNQEWTVPIFDLLRPWQPKDGPSNRKVWIRANGIPLHAWSHGFFHILVSRFGSLISITPETENESKLDYVVHQIITTVFKPISWEINALIDDLSFHINIDEIFQPPVGTILSATPHFPTLGYSKPFSNSSSTSKPSSPRPPPSPKHVASTGVGPVASSGHHASDPFNLMPIIVNSIRPMNGRACSDTLKFQSCSVVALGDANPSYGQSNSYSSAWSTIVANTCNSPHNSSTDSSSPSTHVCSCSPDTSASPLNAETGGENRVEIVVMTKDLQLRQLEEAEINAIVAAIEAKIARKAIIEAAKQPRIQAARLNAEGAELPNPEGGKGSKECKRS
ncbi:hypothetical protein Tsubulata_033600 [Turnera subulata]|uniref:DUF4283 domain-containing protein n=1 Tax=Turnera subulata TaxID=218843 RepID=A0A9Q0GJU3_9ROSI|nr:hypothetical protein Tsubulata_033600 [Turnera subulata]